MACTLLHYNSSVIPAFKLFTGIFNNLRTMKLFSFAIAALFVACVHGAVLEELPVVGRLTNAAILRLREQIRAAGGCNMYVLSHLSLDL